jgi:hypothetical protein
MDRVGVGGAPAGSCLLHALADDGDGGGEVVEGHVEGGARVADGEGNELQPSPVLFETRNDEGGVFLGLCLDLSVASEVPAEADLDENEAALCPVKKGQVWGGRI